MRSSSGSGDGSAASRSFSTANTRGSGAPRPTERRSSSTAWEVAQNDQLNFRPDRAARFLHAYGQDAPALELAIPLIRAGLRESIRIILAEKRDGLPIDQEYLTPQLRAFHELRR